MTIIDRATTPDGIKIQMEKTSGVLQIGAYPLTKRGSKYGIIQQNRPYRLTLVPVDADEAHEVYEALKSGEKTIEDLSRLFYEGERDKFFMGMDSAYSEL